MDKVDCVGEGKDICSKHGVSGYPTLKVFRNGAMEKDYDGPREASKSIKLILFTKSTVYVVGMLYLVRL